MISQFDRRGAPQRLSWPAAVHLQELQGLKDVLTDNPCPRVFALPPLMIVAEINTVVVLFTADGSSLVADEVIC